MSDNNGIKYTITPTQERPPPPSTAQGWCRVKRTSQFVANIYGGGFQSGNWGSDLLAQLYDKCGPSRVHNWGFEYFDKPADDGTEWHAHAEVNIYVSKGCVGKAIEAAGGFPNKC